MHSHIATRIFLNPKRRGYHRLTLRNDGALVMDGIHKQFIDTPILF